MNTTNSTRPFFHLCTALCLAVLPVYAEKQGDDISQLRKAAEQGDADAQCELAECYIVGRGVPTDYVEVAKWFHKAAEQGHADAQYKLGHCLLNGRGVQENDEEAVKWLRKAAEQGYAKAQFNLGICCFQGEGVSQDDAAAYAWFNISAASGNDDAKDAREKLESKLTKEVIAKGQKLSREWRPKPAVESADRSEASRPGNTQGLSHIENPNDSGQAKPLTNQEMSDTANERFERTDAELNDVYKKALKKLEASPENNSEGVTALKESQRAWLILRDKTSEAFASKSGGGTIQNMLYMQCQQSMAARRIRELKHLFLTEDNLDPSYEE